MKKNIYLIENVFHDYSSVSVDEFVANLKTVKRLGLSYHISVIKTSFVNRVCLSHPFGL